MTLVVKAIYVENDIGCEIMGQRSNECNILTSRNSKKFLFNTIYKIFFDVTKYKNYLTFIWSIKNSDELIARRTFYFIFATKVVFFFIRMLRKMQYVYPDRRHFSNHIVVFINELWNTRKLVIQIHHHLMHWCIPIWLVQIFGSLLNIVCRG